MILVLESLVLSSLLIDYLLGMRSIVSAIPTPDKSGRRALPRTEVPRSPRMAGIETSM